jgi:hypothetical protein
MMRATTAALMAGALLLPAMARSAQKAEAEPAPAVTEPEQPGAEVAPPAPGAKKEGKGQESTYETYVVKPGDTLWDLSSKYLGNPWYWPKVWSYNPEIENPHWIYPGNNIRFYPSGDEGPAQVEEQPQTTTTELGEVTSGSINSQETFGEDEDVVAIAGGMKYGYKPDGKHSLFRQDGLITQRELDESGVIEKSYSEKEMMDNYDKVYVRFKNKSAVRLGERYSIFRTGESVKHPITGSNFGYLTRIVGTMRIVALDKEYVTGMIDTTVDDIHRGDFVGPLGNFDKQIIYKDNLRQVKGVILTTLMDALTLVGEQHWVFIDKGSRDGVEEGNTFTVMHNGDRVLDESNEKKFPEEIAGTLLVVDVKEHTSSCLVMRSVDALEIGDTVVMRPITKAASATP